MLSFTIKGGFFEIDGSQLRITDAEALFVGIPIRFSFDRQPALRVVVLPMRLTMTSWMIKGFPRQFMLMWLNMRCSVLFHLLVPGGKWNTDRRNPDSFANLCCGP